MKQRLKLASVVLLGLSSVACSSLMEKQDVFKNRQFDYLTANNEDALTLPTDLILTGAVPYAPIPPARIDRSLTTAEVEALLQPPGNLKPARPAAPIATSKPQIAAPAMIGTLAVPTAGTGEEAVSPTASTTAKDETAESEVGMMVGEEAVSTPTTAAALPPAPVASGSQAKVVDDTLRGEADDEIAPPAKVEATNTNAENDTTSAAETEEVPAISDEVNTQISSATETEEVIIEEAPTISNEVEEKTSSATVENSADLQYEDETIAVEDEDSVEDTASVNEASTTAAENMYVDANQPAEEDALSLMDSDPAATTELPQVK